MRVPQLQGARRCVSCGWLQYAPDARFCCNCGLRLESQQQGQRKLSARKVWSASKAMGASSGGTGALRATGEVSPAAAGARTDRSAIPATRASFLIVPDDVIAHVILPMLPVSGLISLSACCSVLWRVVSDDSLWQTRLWYFLTKHLPVATRDGQATTLSEQKVGESTVVEEERVGGAFGGARSYLERIHGELEDVHLEACIAQDASGVPVDFRWRKLFARHVGELLGCSRSGCGCFFRRYAFEVRDDAVPRRAAPPRCYHHAHPDREPAVEDGHLSME